MLAIARHAMEASGGRGLGSALAGTTRGADVVGMVRVLFSLMKQREGTGG